MERVQGVAEQDATGLVKEIYEEMKSRRGWAFVPLIWRVMALNPPYLQANWERYQAIMMTGSLDSKVKEMIALTVSMVNRCNYCIDSHSGALRKMGMTDGELMELVAVIDFFAGTNVLSSGLGLEFEQSAPKEMESS